MTPPGRTTLTTQLHFPGVVQNDFDGIFDPRGLLSIAETPDGLLGGCTFAL